MNSIRTKVVSVMTVILLAFGLAGVSVVADATITPQEQISSASAHDKSFDVTCAVASGYARYYDANATIKVVLDGVTLIDGKVPGAGYTLNQALTPTENHRLTVTIRSFDGAQYNLDYDKFTTDCQSPTQSYDCSVISADYHRPLVNGDHINATLTPPGSQVNMYVDQNVAGGADYNGQNDLGLRWKIFGVEQTPIPLTISQIESGVITFPYAASLTQLEWTISFLQTNSTDTYPNYHCNNTPQDATATVVVDTPETCLTSSTVKAEAQFATLDAPLDLTVGTHDASFTAIADHFFDNGTNKKIVSYTILPADPTLCPKDATAEVVLDEQATCLTSSTAKEATMFATLDAPLDLTVGTHDASFTADPGHFFADSSTHAVVPYTIKAADPLLCPKDASASASVDTLETCDNISTVKLNLVNAVLGIASYPTSVGVHTVPVEAVAGHVFANGTTHDTVSYEIKAKKTGQSCEKLGDTGVDPSGPLSLAGALVVAGMMLIPWTRKRIYRLFRRLYYKLTKRAQGAHVLT